MTMPLRTVPATNVTLPRTSEMRRVVFSSENILAVWSVPGPNGVGAVDVAVEVSTAMQAKIMSWGTIQTMLDAISTDTISQAVAP